jgi:hypothetical protein
VRLPQEIQTGLDTSGLPWGLEKGTKHYKLRVAGRMVGILPQNGKFQTTDKTAIKNTISQIRRAVRDLTGGTAPSKRGE